MGGERREELVRGGRARDVVGLVVEGRGEPQVPVVQLVSVEGRRVSMEADGEGIEEVGESYLEAVAEEDTVVVVVVGEDIGQKEDCKPGEEQVG